MITKIIVVCLVLCLASLVAADEEEADEKLEDVKYDNVLSRGFGDDIKWIAWDEARDEAARLNKPIFLLIHKRWCHACLALKHKFQDAAVMKEFKGLSRHFVMTNTEDHDEPWEDEFSPDGKYIPRLLFLDPAGELMTNIFNDKSDKNYKFYYDEPELIISAMKKVKSIQQKDSDKAKKAQKEL